ncbi:GNAT family N-acetyltransferase [Shimia sagamensis]|uniref:Protein N-acetyltransferase, RimJ/RimL family n=1 Tax=Shimia sagamensis TaxID=1566352 RepID=A0ABY1P5Z8_9RHOB|nr:GNAT family N-acetyltransferase [Shimia sagamensis]SMP27130.1 Protein N-acetyltransferase, RimJ/RimL family [Shimia sagamensis]
MTLHTTYPWEAPATGTAAAMATQMEMCVPTLETPRLTLRSIRLTDFETFYGILSSERAAYMDGPFDRDEAWFEFTQCVSGWMLRGVGYFAIVKRDTGAILGFVGLGMEFGDQEHELGYFLTEEAEGNGYATDAAEAVRDFGLGQQGLLSLVSYVDPANTSAAAVAERLGAKRDTQSEELFAEPVQIWRHKLEAYA